MAPPIVVGVIASFVVGGIGALIGQLWDYGLVGFIVGASVGEAVALFYFRNERRSRHEHPGGGRS
jgi:O-antigen/teichoic acid export membrane protein